MKTYKCSRKECNKQATHILSFRNIDREFRGIIAPSAFVVCGLHIGKEDESCYYPTIEEYTALRAMYEL